MIQGDFKTATMDTMARIITVLMVVAAGAIPFISEISVYFIALLPLTLLITWLFSITGYSIENNSLTVYRPLWKTIIEVPQGAVAQEEAEIKKGLMKVMGNGGLFGYTGGFRNKKLGNFKTYATNWGQAVSIICEAESFCIVVTPEDTRQLIQCING